MTVECRFYRCARQPEMYLYVRDGMKPEALPETLLARTGRLTEVMSLKWAPERALARVDVNKVIEQLAGPGYFLQMPPPAIITAHLPFGYLYCVQVRKSVVLGKVVSILRNTVGSLTN